MAPLGRWQVPAGGGKAYLGLQGGRGLGPSRPAQWPMVPPQAEQDLGCLLSILVARLRLGTPRINTFSGDATPGKIEVSFEQWYHEVQCIRDHYPELVVLESIIGSLKGAVVDMGWYMSPTASVAHILQKLSVIFGKMASFDILMQNIYKVTQGNNKRFPLLPQGWKRSSTRSNYNALGG